MKSRDASEDVKHKVVGKNHDKNKKRKLARKIKASVENADPQINRPTEDSESITGSNALYLTRNTGIRPFGARARLQGIGNEPVQSLGLIKIKILGYILEVIVISENFPITHTGILGLEFFTDSHAVLNFKENYLEIDEKRFKIFQGENLDATGNLISNINSIGNISLPIIQVLNPPTGTVERFLVDSGSEVNSISSKLLPYVNIINNRKRNMLRGINEEIYITLGTIEISILGVNSVFHVVSEEIKIPEIGILGARYLTDSQAIIDFGNEIFTVLGTYKP